MEIADTIEIEGGYTVEIHYDEDVANPLKEYDQQPILVLHRKAEGHFGWSNDREWSSRLNIALDTLAASRVTKQLYGERGALAVIARWLRVFHDVAAVLSVGAGEHSGTWVYLGEGASFGDPGGWDSGWIGWLLVTQQMLGEWGHVTPVPQERAQEMLEAEFETFRQWVAGEVYGYVVEHEDHEVEDNSCWGFFGSDSYAEGDHMRGEFMAVIEADRRQQQADRDEIADLAKAEIGA